VNQSTEQTDASPGAAPPVVSAPNSASSAQRDMSKCQQALVAIGRRAVVAPEPTVLMHDAAVLAAEALNADYFSVAQISPHDGSLEIRLATMKDEEGQTQEVTTTAGSGNARGLTAHVVKASCPVLVDDLPQDKRFRDPMLEKCGLRSAIVVPMLHRDEAFGALGVYSMQSNRFSEEDALFVEMTVHFAATSVARSQTEDLLAAEHKQVNQLRQTVNAMVLKLDSRWRIQETNRTCELVTGFTLPDLRNRVIWSVFPAADHEEEAKRVQEELRNGRSPVTYEGDLLTKHSQRRRIAWAYSATVADDGTLESILATGVDVTELDEALEKVERVEQEARNVRRSLVDLTGGGPADESDSGEPVQLPPEVERRGRPRRAYRYRQRVAEVVDGMLPNVTDFDEVFCNDISAGGFSFLAEVAPRSDTLVVALGIHPRVIYVTAQVVHITRVERDGRRMFLVGCNYMSRVKY